MNVSTKGYYALQALFDLASQRSDEPVKIASIAKRQRIPQKFLELILASLKQGGFVESRRGAEGGYYLARLPETITVGQVLRFIEVPAQKQQGLKRETPFSELWRDVDKSVAEIVEHTDFASIVCNWAEKQRTYTHDWEI
jgi:Rrf2 family transcriptional regulator, cysteine metabolism repressor